MSKQIEKLMQRRPDVFYDVSYEGNGDGTWLYMQPGWYCASSDCGTIHEYTIKDVLACAKHIYFDEQRWRDEHPEHEGPLPVYKKGE